jgi:hypothetical protein
VGLQSGSQTFNSSSHGQAFTVPDSVTSIAAEATGASGGGSGGSGGTGGYARVDIEFPSSNHGGIGGFDSATPDNGTPYGCRAREGAGDMWGVCAGYNADDNGSHFCACD